MAISELLLALLVGLMWSGQRPSLPRYELYIHFIRPIVTAGAEKALQIGSEMLYDTTYP